MDLTDEAPTNMGSLTEENDKSMWDDIPSEDDENDVPAFLRRRKKNKDKKKAEEED